MKKIMFIWTLISIASFCRAQPLLESENNHTFQKFIESTSEFRPAAMPGSTGTFGLQVGMSFERVPMASQSFLNNYYLPQQEREFVSFSRMLLQKGLNGPFDFGVSLGQDKWRHLTAWHAFLQWTILEKFRSPTVSSRIYYSQIYNLSYLNANTTGFELSAGQSFFSFFNPYVAVGVALHQSRYQSIGANNDLQLIAHPDEMISTQKVRPYLRYGMRVRLFFPYLNYAIEEQISEQNTDFRRYTHAVQLGY